jgi:hypothetical protein
LKGYETVERIGTTHDKKLFHSSLFHKTNTTKLKHVVKYIVKVHTKMTYNPDRYEHQYGFHLIDDIHNLFPEFLYDSGMFPGNQIVTFLQMRTHELFPEEYARNRGNYRLYQLERRRREAGIPTPAQLLAQQSQQSQPPQTPPRRIQPIRVPATPTRPTMRSRLQQPLAQQPQQAEQGTYRQPRHPLQPPEIQTYTLPLTSFFTTLTDTTNLNTLLASALLGTRQDLADLLTPVAVFPTEAQLAAGSIVSNVEPPADVTCTICQDHAQPLPTSAEWRILRHCGHRFHRSCIDEWYRQNVHCPVCRHDIREVSSNEVGA